MSRTLILVKPDAFERALTGEVIARFERKGLRIVALKSMTASEEIAHQHYAEHTEKPFFGELVEFITGGPLVAMVPDSSWALAADTENAAENFEDGTRMKELAESGEITIGVKYDQPGIGFKGAADDMPKGFDPEMGKILAASLGIAPEDITWKETISDNREPFLQSGEVDLVIASYSITDERRQVVGQAGPYYVTGQQLLVKSDSDIESLDDIKGQEVCSVTGSTSLDNVEAEGANPREVDDAFVAGMLHDVGKLALAANFPGVYAEVLVRAQESGEGLLASEIAEFGANHAEIGGHLLALWGLPAPVVDAVAWHHDPMGCSDRSFGPLACVHAANAWSHEGNAGEWLGIVEDFYEKIDLAHRLDHWHTACLGTDGKCVSA